MDMEQRLRSDVLTTVCNSISQYSLLLLKPTGWQSELMEQQARVSVKYGRGVFERVTGISMTCR